MAGQEKDPLTKCTERGKEVAESDKGSSEREMIRNIGNGFVLRGQAWWVQDLPLIWMA